MLVLALAGTGCGVLGRWTDGPRGVCDAEPVSTFGPLVERPQHPVPFFAPRAGALPPDGPATVAGVELPPGTACGTYWATDDPLTEMPPMSRLTAAFPKTGLWPVLWLPPDAHPRDHLRGDGDPRAADRLDAESILRGIWRDRFPGYRFRGLAQRVPGAGRGELAGDPWRTLTHPMREERGPAPVLVLVSVNRPADVVAALAPRTTELMSDAERTAVLRSWEERFGAVPMIMEPDSLNVGVDAMPSRSRLRELARTFSEVVAFAPGRRTDPTTRFWLLDWRR